MYTHLPWDCRRATIGELSSHSTRFKERTVVAGTAGSLLLSEASMGHHFFGVFANVLLYMKLASPSIPPNAARQLVKMESIHQE